MGLLGVELTRWRARPAVAALMLAAVLFALVAAGLTAWESRALTEAERDDAVSQAELTMRDPGVRAEVDACRESPTDYLGPDAVADDCLTVLAPDPQRFWPRTPLDLAEVLPQRGVEVALVVVCLMVVAASTFVGADWATGSMRTQLLVEPRRLRVWLAKAVAALVWSAATTAVALLGFWGVLAAVARARGLEVGEGVALDAAAQAGRSVVLAACAALGAFALTMALRHTVATLGLLFVYAVGGEIALGLLPVPDVTSWSVGRNALEWVHDGPGEAFTLAGSPYLGPAAFLGALTMVAVLVSLPVFTRRDV